MTSAFNINIQFGNSSKLLNCSTRRELGGKIAKFCGLAPTEYVLYQKKKNSLEPVTLNEVKDLMRLEVRRLDSTPVEVNGQRLESLSHIPVKTPDTEELLRKLRENRVLSGLEREFIIHFVENFSNKGNGKRKRNGEDEGPKQVANKKIQVDSSSLKHSSYTQTDQLRTLSLDKPSTSADLVKSGILLAKEEKKDKMKVCKLMNETFETRRHDIITKNLAIIIIKERYPLLFSVDEVRNELNRIFYDKKDEEFLSNIIRSSKPILSLVDEDNELLKIINDKINSASTPTQKQYAREVGALLLISNVIHEKRTYLDTDDEPCEINNYPRIEASCTVTELFNDERMYKIVVEGKTLCKANNFPEAILCLVASYFIFNISYPDKSFNTFVLMEKIFLEAHDTEVEFIDESTQQIIKLIKLKTS